MMRNNSNPQRSLDERVSKIKFCPYDGYKYQGSESYCFICKQPRSLANDDNQDDQSQEKQKNQSKKWKKVLYEPPEHEDTYTHSEFLSCMEVVDVQNELSFSEMVFKTNEIIFAINLIAIYLVTFYNLKLGVVESGWLLASEFIFTMAGVMIYFTINSRPLELEKILRWIFKIILITLICYVLTPFYKNMNRSYADDTIYAMTTGSILIHLISKDYTLKNSSPRTWRVDFSTFFAFVIVSLLVSRLETTTDVFVMIVASFLCFIFSHFFNKSIKDYSKSLYKYLHALFSLTNLILIYQINRLTAFWFILLYLGITQICPLWIIFMYQYKDVVKGPWDLPNIKVYQ